MFGLTLLLAVSSPLSCVGDTPYKAGTCIHHMKNYHNSLPMLHIRILHIRLVCMFIMCHGESCEKAVNNKIQLCVASVTCATENGNLRSVTC